MKNNLFLLHAKKGVLEEDEINSDICQTIETRKTI